MTLLTRRAVVVGLAGLLAVLRGRSAPPAAADPPPGSGPGVRMEGSSRGVFWSPDPGLLLPPAPDPGQLAWVGQSLARMEAVHPGMTRAQMEDVFVPAGGLHAHREVAPLVGTYAYRGCPFFQVEIEFRPVRPPERAAGGWLHTPPDPRDVITSLSRPYLARVAQD